MIALIAAVVGGVVLAIACIFGVTVLKSRRLRWKIEKQGVRGPPPSSLLLGNIPQILQIKSQFTSDFASTNDGSFNHDWSSYLFPHLKLWHQQYGPVLMYTTGSTQFLSITDPLILKQIMQCPPLDLGKPSFVIKERGPLLGEGVISSSGALWAYQRKIISPEFFPDKVKGMLRIMVETATSMLQSWEARIQQSGGPTEMRVDEDLKNMSADVISKVAFGSSYAQGKHIFAKIRSLQKLLSAIHLVGIPGSRHMPTKKNLQLWRLEKEINNMILGVVKERMSLKHEEDFLGKILEAARSCKDEVNHALRVDHEKFIVDNCKSIYFAGHETTASTVAWSLMLMALYPDWQARARAEVLQVCPDGIPAAEDLRNMKVLTMVIQETLRLYPPAIMVTRSGLDDTVLNGIQLPKGTDIQIPILLLHLDPEIWGADVHKFNPERFAGGTVGACKVPQAYMPFGFGSRVCLGQHFAMVQLKVTLSLILSKFRFSLSTVHVHRPAIRLTVEPEHGVQLVLGLA